LRSSALTRVSQESIQVDFEYLHRRRLHSLSGQPVPVLCHRHSEGVSPHVHMELPHSSLCSLPLVLPLGTAEQSLAPYTWLLTSTDKIPSQPSFLHVTVKIRYLLYTKERKKKTKTPERPWNNPTEEGFAFQAPRPCAATRGAQRGRPPAGVRRGLGTPPAEGRLGRARARPRDTGERSSEGRGCDR